MFHKSAELGLQEQSPHRASDARGRIAQEPAGVSPPPAGLLHPRRLWIDAIKHPADQVVERIDTPNRFVPQIEGVTIRPVAGDRQEVTIVAEMVVVRDHRGDTGFDSSGELPRLLQGSIRRQNVQGVLEVSCDVPGSSPGACRRTSG